MTHELFSPSHRPSTCLIAIVGLVTAAFATCLGDPAHAQKDEQAAARRVEINWPAAARDAVIAGIAAGLLSLVRSLGLLVAPATILVLLWRRRWSAAVALGVHHLPGHE